MAKYWTKIEIHGNILITDEFTPKVPKNYYLKWKQRDQEYYKFSASKGVDLYKILGTINNSL